MAFLGYAILLLIVLAASAGSLSGQSVDEGLQVRLHQRGASAIVATPERLSADTLWVRWGGDTVLPIPRTAIDRLDVRTRSAVGPTVVRWGVAGFALGAALGAISCASEMPQCKANLEVDTTGEAYLWSSLGVGIVSSGVGAVAGLLMGRHRWESRPVTDLAIP